MAIINMPQTFSFYVPVMQESLDWIWQRLYDNSVETRWVILYEVHEYLNTHEHQPATRTIEDTISFLAAEHDFTRDYLVSSYARMMTFGLKASTTWWVTHRWTGVHVCRTRASTVSSQPSLFLGNYRTSGGTYSTSRRRIRGWLGIMADKMNN